MSMQDIYLTFEFSKIREAILEYHKSEIAKEKIESLKMFSSREEVKNALLDLEEMSSLLLRFGPLPISNSANALYLIDLAKKTGLLTPRDLNLIAEDVLTSQRILKYFQKIDSGYSRTLERISHFVDLDNLEKEIHRVITNSLTISDDATPELKEIRHQMKKLEQELNQKIQTLSLTYSSYLNDINATIREGHFVLPVRTVDKNKVMGIVYDVSDSGNTTFIEPLEIVQINNAMTSLKVQENEEIRKILRQLTSLCLIQESEILTNNSIIGELDFLSAKAQYGNQINGVIASIKDEQYLSLIKARHPLIDPRVVVSNSYHLDENKRLVIISGPNAGGKTVSLKTMGLLTLMNQCGLMVPAQKAELGYFNHIYIDIGDNQSLSDNLSTFSAHMSQIAEIINVIKTKDLVLLDELGTGTDPKEGEALALAISQELENRHCLGMISSHFSSLKEYAFTSSAMENSSMIFDEKKLSPTYIFVQGMPGHSYALNVAKRYGICDDILARSEKYMQERDKNETTVLFETLQKKMEENNLLAASLEKEKIALEARIKKLESEESSLKTRKENLLKDVENEKAKIIEHAQEEIDTVMANLNKEGIKLHEVIELKKQIDNLSSNPETILYDEEINVDDYVSLPSLNMEGRVKRIKGQKAFILTNDGFSFEVEINKLHKIPHKEGFVKPKKTVGYDEIIKTSVGLELNIIGLRADEAKEKLIKYLDDCRLKHLSTVRIIHGFGSGALRKMTHEYLDKQKDLTYRPGNMHEGGGGATVITFK